MSTPMPFDEFRQAPRETVELPPFPRQTNVDGQIESGRNLRNDLRDALARELTRTQDYLGDALVEADRRASVRDRLTERVSRDNNPGGSRRA